VGECRDAPWLGCGRQVVGGGDGRVEGKPRGADGMLKVLPGVAAQRARRVAQQPGGHGRSPHAYGLVVSEPSDQFQQVIRRCADLGALRPDLDGDRCALASIAQDLDERVGDSGALGAGAQLRGTQLELGAGGRVSAAGELFVEAVAPPSGSQANGKTGTRTGGVAGTRIECGNGEDAPPSGRGVCRNRAVGAPMRLWV
jgi:hypothetical protein